MASNEYTPEDKVGHISEIEDRIVWPKVNVLGRTYNKPASTVSIGRSSFVVVPRMITPEVTKAIEEVKAAVTIRQAVDALVEVEETSKKGK